MPKGSHRVDRVIKKWNPSKEIRVKFDEENWKKFPGEHLRSNIKRHLMGRTEKQGPACKSFVSLLVGNHK
jgi:hypothetical protein